MDEQMTHETLPGKDFEFEMSKFLFKRVIDQNFDDFKLTREKKGFGKFDDLAYTYDINGTKKFSLVQFKHLQDEAKRINFNSLVKDKKSGQFFLPKYFNHYLESSKKISVDPDFEDCELESLIICTNIDFDTQLDVIKKVEVKNNSNNELFKGIGNERKLWGLKISDNDKKTVFLDSYRPEHERLADELMEHVMLAKEINLKDMKRVGKESLVRKYHIALEKYVINIRNGGLKKTFLEGKNTAHAILFQLKKCFMNSVKVFCSKYENSSTDELQREFHIKHEDSKELKKKILLYNKTKHKIDFFRKQNVVIVQNSPFGDEKSYPNDAKQLPGVENVNEAVVNKEIDEFLSKLVFAVNHKNYKFLLEAELKIEVYIKFNNVMNHWYHEQRLCYKDSGTEMRKWITKKKLMENALKFVVDFQGEKIPLENLLPDNKENRFLDPDLLMRTFCQIEISVGGKFDDLVNYHVNRFLFRTKRIESGAISEILRKNANDVFAFKYFKTSSNEEFFATLLPPNESLQSVTNMSANSSFYFIADQRECDKIFTKYLYLFRGKRVHYFSHDSSTSPSFDTNVAYTEYIYEADLCNNSCFSTVVAEPGMGKSTLVKSLAKTLVAENKQKKQKPEYVIRVELKCYRRQIKEIEVGKIESIVDFLCLLDGFKEHSFLRNVITHFLKKEERIILLFDGFDELYDDGTRQNMSHLLTYLRNEAKVKHVCVTSRQHCESELNKALGVDSFSIEEITEEEQINFLINFAKRVNEEKEQIIRKNSESLIKKINREVGQVKRSFLGTPLHTYILAVAYGQEIWKEYPDISEPFFIIDLLEYIIRSKCKIFIEEKEGIKITEMNRALLMRIVVNYIDMHISFTFCYWGLLTKADLPENGIKIFIEEDELTKEYGECDEEEYDKDKEMKRIALKIGILYQTNGVMYFAHKEFAEYFVAQRLVSVAFQYNSFRYRDAIENTLLNVNHRFLLHLFDQLIVKKRKFSAHKAAMIGDEWELKSKSKDELQVEDRLGRTPFYFAVQYRQHDIIDVLIDKGVPIDCKEEFLYNALESYVTEFRETYRRKNYDVNDPVFKRFLKFSNHVLQINNSDLAERLSHAYREKLEKGNTDWKLFELLTKNGCDISFAYYCTLHTHSRLPVSTFEAVLNTEKEYDLRVFHFLFMNYFVYLPENEVAFLLQQFEGRLDRCRSYRPLRIGVALTTWIKSIEANSSSMQDFVERFRNSSKFIFSFYKIIFENWREGDFFMQYNSKLLRQTILPIGMNCEKLGIKLSNSISSLKKNYDRLSQEEKEIVDTFKKYESELDFTCQSNTMENDIRLLVTKLFLDFDVYNILYSVSDVTDALLIGDTQHLKDALSRAENSGWLKAAVRVADNVFNVWEGCYNKMVRRGFYDFDHDFSRRPPEEIRQIIEKFEKEI